MDAVALYEEARARKTVLSGYYNRNVRVEADAGPVMVRIPATKAETDAMDLTLWPESAVLDAIQPRVSSAPRLVFASTDPAFQIHEFVDGRRADEVAPDGEPLPDAVLDGIERLFAETLRVPSQDLPPVPEDWPDDGNTAGFAARLIRLVREIRLRGDEATQGLYEDLGIPEDPCARLADRASSLSRRPFRLLHADIHRKNIIISRGRVVFLDWELALWGDPVYDLADHVHKMAYSPAEVRRTTVGWERTAPRECRTEWEAAFEFYLAYERVKSAVVDIVRWGRGIRAAESARERRRLADELVAKIVAGRPHWEAGEVSPPPPSAVEAAALRWTPGAP